MVNSPLFVCQHLQEIISRLSSSYHVVVASSYSDRYPLPDLGCTYVNVLIRRNPSLYDVASLFSIVFLRFRLRPAIVISFTPKAGLFNSLTFFCPGISIHYFTGQRWATLTGIFKSCLQAVDLLISSLVRYTYCDSFSQADFISSQIPITAPRVVAMGSITGVLHSRWISFQDLSLPTVISTFPQLVPVIEEHSCQKTVFGFVGRLCRDKGVYNLLEAFEDHHLRHPSSFLILVGPIEDCALSSIIGSFSSHVIHIDYTDKIELILPLFTALVLPSYREGFGSVLLEAAACHVPAIVTNIPGPVDFVKDSINGLIVQPGNVPDLVRALDYVSLNPVLTQSMGRSAYRKSILHYRSDFVVNSFVDDLKSRFLHDSYKYSTQGLNNSASLRK